MSAAKKRPAATGLRRRVVPRLVKCAAVFVRHPTRWSPWTIGAMQIVGGRHSVTKWEEFGDRIERIVAETWPPVDAVARQLDATATE